MSKEALKLALEALDNLMYWDNGKPDYDEAREAITAIKEALAQPEQEPVAHFGSAYVNENGVHITTVLGSVAIPQDAKLYTTTPQRTWVGLTDEEAHELWESTDSDDDWELMKRTEAKLKEKNT